MISYEFENISAGILNYIIIPGFQQYRSANP